MKPPKFLVILEKVLSLNGMKILPGMYIIETMIIINKP